MSPGVLILMSCTLILVHVHVHGRRMIPRRARRESWANHEYPGRAPGGHGTSAMVDSFHDVS